MHKGEKISLIDAEQYLEPYQKRWVCRPVHLTLSEHTYSPGASPAKSWIPLAFRAFACIAEKRQIRDLLIIGTGNGLDALGAIEIFDLHSITVTDLQSDNVAIAKQNILANLDHHASVQTHFYCSDLFSQVPEDELFCLIYENLPNIPLPPEVNLYESINSASFFLPRQQAVPEIFDNHLLALHYLFLQQARCRIRQGGGVITCIGGRIPLEVVFHLHRECHYAPELILFDIKIQSEPETVLPEYYRAEKEYGIQFTFYTLDAIEIIAAAKQSGITGKNLFNAVKQELDNYAISASEALSYHHHGKDIAHSVFMVFGEPQEVLNAK